MAAVVETIARELIAEWAENNGGMSIAAWAASAITRGEYYELSERRGVARASTRPCQVCEADE
eukprot:10837304-Alexandrium_andersonii.AAC.1